MKVYNTLTRTKEELVPLTPGQLRMYVCGVTVYDLSHIGHARSAIVFDVIRRYLLFTGYRVTVVKNFTDVDDRIIRRANADGVAAREISERYIAEYRADMASLAVRPADVEPKATEHIPQMIALIERLIAGGFAYVVEGDVYFEVRSFPAYGKLSGKNLDELLAGARVEVDERKRDPRDFALWKSAKPGEPSWASPWGPGRPGWHIECSAMSMQYLGESFDVHGGGEDLIFPHHECEIAQSEAATRKPFVKVWVHNGFVNLGTAKMSKSLGNTLTIKEFAKRHDPQAIRLWLLGTHYRNPVEFAEDRMRETARALERLQRLRVDARMLGIEPDSRSAREAVDPWRAFRDRFEAAMDDDFNTPQALGVIFELAHALYDRRDAASREPQARAEFGGGVQEMVSLSNVLGLLEQAPEMHFFSAGETVPAPSDSGRVWVFPEMESTLRDRIGRMLEERHEARAGKNFARADEIRSEIRALGFVVEDIPNGVRLAPKSGPRS